MIIPNGTIKTKQKAGGGIDPETGYAVPPVSVGWGEPIPCQFSATRFDWQAKLRGEPVTQKSFSILIEEQEFQAEQIRLTDRSGKVIGDFPIKQIEPLEAVCQLRIIV